MKPAPPFDREKARADFVDYLRRLIEEGGRTFDPVADVAKNQEWMDSKLKSRENFWPSTWRYQQIAEGGRILDSMLSDLSADTRELIEDYLYDQKDTARTEGYKERTDYEGA